MSTIAQPFLGRVWLVGQDIKLSHSIFALPFALLGAFLAAGHERRLPALAELGLIVLCMVLARTFAMTVNRWADAALDARNPRTAGRAIPSGRLPRSFVLGAAVACALGFIAASSSFYLLKNNPYPLLLSLPVLLFLGGYSFTKRFTWLCHLYLGATLALAPVATAIAVAPAYLANLEPYLLFLMVLCWVAGFDVIYALQDVPIDQRDGLYSIPADLGIKPALWISRLLHLTSFLCLLALARFSALLGPFFTAGVAVVAGLLIVEHALVWGSSTHRLNMAFFTVNGVISLLLGVVGIADIVRNLPGQLG